ncbi:tail fiber domain-containing protein [Burkholderia cepacia]|uniref:tail fiber domain-containing protein n=1 Tax=Burkholderia cepacia TaxID=292 RepID=UPI00158B78A6|nr:tail fiber domain-containing protein [Burkholderia cepacia]
MSVLQKANLGVAPSGAGGDDQRTANMRFNANVDAIAARVPLEYSYLADTATLLPSHAGFRFGLAMPGPDKVVTLPLASSVPVNGCIHLYNVGPPVRIGLQGGDGTQITYLNKGDWAKYVGDGTAWWHVAERGRLMWDETVGGHLTVGNGLNVSGDVSATGRVRTAGLTVDGGAIVGGGVSTSGPFTMTQGLSTGQTRVYNNPGEYNVVLQAGAPGKEMWAVFDPNGYLILPQRPRWLNGLIPWDNDNLKNPMTLDGEQTVSGIKRFTAATSFSANTYYAKQVTINASAPDGLWSNAPLVIAGYPGVGSIGIGSNNGAINLRCSANSGTLDVVSSTSAAFAPVSASAFNVNSDVAIKAEVETIENAMERLKRLRGVTYVMKSDETHARQLGVIAQEVAKEFPEAVTETSMQIDESGVMVTEGGRPMLAVNYSALIGPLLQAFIELEARVSALEG